MLFFLFFPFLFFPFFGQTLSALPPGGHVAICVSAICWGTAAAAAAAALSSHCSSGVIKKAESESLRGEATTGQGDAT